MIEGGIKANKAKNINLPLTDPLQVSILNNLLAQKRRLETGAAYQAQQDEIRQLGREAMNNVMKLGGGNIGASMSGLAQVNRGTLRGLNNLYSNMGLEAMKLSGLIQQQGDTIAQRRLDIPLQEQRRLLGDSAQIQKEALATLLGAGARMGLKEVPLQNINQPMPIDNTSMVNNASQVNLAPSLFSQTLTSFNDSVPPQSPYNFPQYTTR